MAIFAVILVATLSLTSCNLRTPEEIGRFWFKDVPNGPNIASCIMKRESGFNPKAISPTRDYGLFQINRKAHKKSFEKKIGGPFEKVALGAWSNARYARHLYNQAGWSPWRGGNYRCF